MYNVYILQSLKDNKRYIGYTNDIEIRLKFHNCGLNPSTKYRRPFKLLGFKQFETKIEAIRFERYLKKLKGGEQLKIEIGKMLNCAVVAQLVEQLHGKE